MLRTVVFLVGLILMALSVLVPFVVEEGRHNRFRLFELGLLMVLASHGWPSGLVD